MGDGFWGDAVKIFTGAFGGLFGAAGGLVSVRWFITWLTGRHDHRQALLDAQDAAIDERWASYTKRIEQRCTDLEQRIASREAEIDECHRAKNALEARVAKLEGFDHGMGDRRQQEQLARSADALGRSNIDSETGHVGKN